MKKALYLLPFLVVLFALSVVGERFGHAAGLWTGQSRTQGTLVKFEGGIGVIPVASAVGQVVNRNIVRGVQPAGQIWVISALTADVKVDGRIHVDGRGLLLGGGNAIGFNGNASVFATLICEAMAPFTERSTNAIGVALEPNGDFRIDDVLVPAATGQLRQPCAPHPRYGRQPRLVRCGYPETELATGSSPALVPAPKELMPSTA